MSNSRDARLSSSHLFLLRSKSRSRSWVNEQTCATSEKLKQWCERDKDRCYIPESLLKRWQISVDPNVSG
jgi:hypothetical protein